MVKMPEQEAQPINVSVTITFQAADQKDADKAIEKIKAPDGAIVSVATHAVLAFGTVQADEILVPEQPPPPPEEPQGG